MKKIEFIILISFSFIFVQNALFAAGVNTPENTVKNFYTWYLNKQKESLDFTLLDSKVYSFISKKTVNTLRKDYKNNNLPGDSDYFLKVQDYDYNDWITNTVVDKAQINDGVAKVKVTFGSSDKIIVFDYLKQENKVWKIYKVEPDPARR